MMDRRNAPPPARVAPPPEPCTTLLDTPGLRVRRVAHPSPLCVVTFSNYQDAPDRDHPGFGEHFLGRRGIDAIHVTSADNDWFQNPAMDTAIAAIRAALGPKPRITYGSSMGAYAAIRFSAALGASRVIAISPQYALDSRIVPGERRWRREARHVRFLPWADNAPAPPVIALFDPANPDARHVDRWARERHVVQVPIPHAGHPAGTYLAELGLLSGTVLDILDGRFDPVRLLARVHAGRRRSARYYAALAAAQPASRPTTRAGLMRHAVGMAPTVPHYTSQLAILLYRAGDDAGAAQAHHAALALSPNDPLLLFRASLFEQRLGRFDTALALARRAEAARPGWPPLARHADRLAVLAGPPGPRRTLLRILDAAFHRATRAAWRRGWTIGRLATP